MQKTLKVCKAIAAAQSGEKGHNAKLTWEQVREIRARYATGGITQTALARDYSLTPQHINDIILNKQWKEV